MKKREKKIKHLRVEKDSLKKANKYSLQSERDQYVRVEKIKVGVGSLK